MAMNHEDHIKGGYFVEGCERCMRFKQWYEKKRAWKNGTEGR